jgi:hypothetical protein
MTLTRERLEEMAIATAEFDTMSHEDIQEMARLALKAIDMIIIRTDTGET